AQKRGLEQVRDESSPLRCADAPQGRDDRALLAHEHADRARDAQSAEKQRRETDESEETPERVERACKLLRLLVGGLDAQARRAQPLRALLYSPLQRGGLARRQVRAIADHAAWLHDTR